MVRDIRIKDYRFVSATIANGSVIAPVFSDSSINGEVLAISIKGSTSAGSYFFGESGLNLEFARHTTIISGTASQRWYPRSQISSDISGGALIDAGSGNYFTSAYVNSPIYYLASGVSGGRVTGEIVVTYR